MLGKSMIMEGMDSSKINRMHQTSKVVDKAIAHEFEFDQFIAFCRTTTNPLLQNLKMKSQEDLDVMKKHIMSWFKSVRSQAADQVIKADASSHFEPVEVVFDQRKIKQVIGSMYEHKDQVALTSQGIIERYKTILQKVVQSAESEKENNPQLGDQGQEENANIKREEEQEEGKEGKEMRKMVKVGDHLHHIQMKKEEQLRIQEREIKEVFREIKQRLEYLMYTVEWKDEMERKKLTKKYQDYLEKQRAFSAANSLMNKYE